MKAMELDAAAATDMVRASACRHPRALEPAPVRDAKGRKYRQEWFEEPTVW